MQIGTNSIAQMAVRAIHSANAAAATASERISTGFRINRASDDPGAMVLGNLLKTQITSMAKAIDNVSQGYAITQIADSTLSQLSDILGYLQSSAATLLGGTLTGDELTAEQETYDAYVISYNAILDTSAYNDIDLMSSGTIDIHAGTGVSTSNQIPITLSDMSMSLNAGASIATADLTTITAQISIVNDYQSYMGAMANVLTAQSDALTSTSTAYSTAYGNVMNADLAQETTNLASAQIQRDGATAMLAQANGMNKEIVAFLLQSVTS